MVAFAQTLRNQTLVANERLPCVCREDVALGWDASQQ